MNKIKIPVITIFGAVFSWLGFLAIPFAILFGCNLVDYITGICAAKYRVVDDERPVKSYISIRGIFKKIGMWVLVLVGWGIDLMLQQGLVQFDISLPFKYVIATLVICWLIFNEMLSILENLDDIGVAIPPFLRPLIKMMKKQSEKSMAESLDDEDDKLDDDMK